MISNQNNRKNSQTTDLLAKIRPTPLNKPNLVQHLARSNPIQVSSGLKMLNTRIPGVNDPSYQPLVTISDDDNSEEENFVSPIHKLTKTELREELKIFKPTTESNQSTTHHALLGSSNGDDDEEDDAGDIQFRTHETIKRLTCCPSYLSRFHDYGCIVS